jgi:peptidoglycan pentaglycine glycine transferase (the first glycine)
MPELNASEWKAFLERFPNAHLLQTQAWGDLKAAFGWDVVRLVAGDSGAQILFRRLPLGFSMAYIPKGPVGEDWDPLWPEIDAICRQRRAVFLKVEADLWERETDQLWGGAPPPGFHLSPHEIQPRCTLLVDLQPSEDQILAQMKQKTRYNIRLALKKGVVVRPSNDVSAFHQLMQVTSERDVFGVHTLEYYRQAYDLIVGGGGCQLFFAEYQHEPLAALMIFKRGDRAWYFYGASSDLERNRMPTYILQWEAMRWARSQGCKTYDLWGVPDVDAEILEANFTGRNDGLWGVYRFKRGFGGELLRAVPTWDWVYIPLLYKAYQWYVGIRGQSAS